MALIEAAALSVAAKIVSEAYPAIASAIGGWAKSKVGSGNVEVQIAGAPVKISFDADDLQTLQAALQDQFPASDSEKKKASETDVNNLKVVLVSEALSRAHARLEKLVPQARSRYRLAKRLRIAGSVIALISNVTVLSTLGLPDRTAPTIAAIIALLVSMLKLFEDYFVAGITGDKPQRLLELLTQTNGLVLEAGECLFRFRTLATAKAPYETFPLSDAERIVAETNKVAPEMELASQ